MGQQSEDKKNTAQFLKKAIRLTSGLTVVVIIVESLLLLCRSSLCSNEVWIFLIVAFSFLALTGFLLLALVSVVRDE
jgi:accessory gene regulator protein AgrB